MRIEYVFLGSGCVCERERKKMSQMGEILRLCLQGREEERGTEARRTIEAFLREGMDGLDGIGRRRTLKERFGFKGIGCCGPTWGLGPTTISVRGDDEEDEVRGEVGGPQRQEEQGAATGENPIENGADPGCLPYIPAGSGGMNLATALAAERNFRAGQENPEGGGGSQSSSPSPLRTNNGPGDATAAAATPLRVSLLRLLEETDCSDEAEREEERKGTGSDSLCCVCMGRKKGAAFIPCGHTFCRVCSRELWWSRGTCPLCNRSIVEVLDIF